MHPLDRLFFWSQGSAVVVSLVMREHDIFLNGASLASNNYQVLLAYEAGIAMRLFELRIFLFGRNSA